MKVSFLVTFYNQKKYIKNCLDSILSVEKPCDWEVLIGDDGSSDGSSDIYQKYLSKYPDNFYLYVMPRDDSKEYYFVKRASENRLNLLKHATGDFFFTIDGDDMYIDNHFVNDAIKIYKTHSDVSLVSFGYSEYKNGKETKVNTLNCLEGYVDSELYLRKMFLIAGSFAHKKCFTNDRIKFITELGYFDDNNITINSLNFGRIYAINRPIYGYSVSDGAFGNANIIEQNIITVQGADEDIQLVEDEYKDAILERNLRPIISLYLDKRNIENVIGIDKYNKYVNMTSKDKNPILYNILNYSFLTSKEKRKFNRFINKIFCMDIKTSAHIFKDHLRRSIKE